jgi:hypothetical protein
VESPGPKEKVYFLAPKWGSFDRDALYYVVGNHIETCPTCYVPNQFDRKMKIWMLTSL